ncbi:MAG: VCBS repeat-containing protein [Clostridia bacterium]|nr:VCBS repeat-containing protein [Clostridia bacterium]
MSTLLLFSLFLGAFVGCTPDAPPTDTSNSETETESDPVQSDAPTTEETTEPPVQAFIPSSELVQAENFSLSEIYHVVPTTREESVSVNLDGLTLQVDMNSTFFGTESAIDRDTHHWADILRYTNRNITDFQDFFRVGDLNGDRRGEILTYKDGTLTVYTMPKVSGKKTKKLTTVMTHELGFEGFLIGTGHINSDLYTDILLYNQDAQQVMLGLGSKDGFDYVYAGALEDLDTSIQLMEYLMCGDIDADGTTEIVWINTPDVTVYHYENGSFTKTSQDTLPCINTAQFVTYAVSDMNSDGAADVVCYMYDAGTDAYGTRTYMSRRDGHFGSYEHEGDNKNLNVTHLHNEYIVPLYAAGGDVTGDGVDDIVLIGMDTDAKVSVYAVEYVVEAPAYDYSSHVIKIEDGYILYTGGLYIDYNTDKYPQTDGDHIMAYTSKDGLTWHRNLDAACFYLGGELGLGGYQPGDVYSEKWWYGNTMEPEVILVDGVYYMYFQVENYTYDKSGQLMGADRIGVATSTDGIHFERKTDSPALISSDQYSCFTHQEVIYVPDDPDGLCFWMYVRYVHNNFHVKHIRVRSADPLCFDMDKDCTEVSGFHQIGNQVGYINDYDGNGNRLFVRITFTEYDEKGDGKKVHTVPTLQFSPDGINWTLSGLYMAGADPDNEDEWTRRNVYFLGFSTINGTGEIPKAENGEGYEFIWVSCTCDSPVAPNIFYSSEGMGKATFNISIQ